MSDMTSANDELSAFEEASADEPGATVRAAARDQVHRRVWTAGLWPAFRDSRTGETHLAMTADGQRALQHSFDCLPDHWIVERDAHGQPLCLHQAVKAGYWRSPEFFALDAELSLPLDA